MFITRNHTYCLFYTNSIVLNGNGKYKWEIKLAIMQGCLINVDSLFDLKHIIDIARDSKKIAAILIRLNPQIDAVKI